MIGAIIGDIVGSRFEWHNHRNKDFELFTSKCFATDDSIMTLAIGEALMRSRPDWSDLGAQAVRCMQEIGRPYPTCGYGARFTAWIYSPNPEPFNSYGNGAAMRVSACGFVAKSLEEAKALSKAVTEVSHNHPEGIKGAEATTVAIFLARTGHSMQEIRDVIDREYYPMNFTLDEIRPTYMFNETCQGTVPQALMAFFESTSFEDAIRNAISVGGDSDTLAAITGGVAEAFYGVPKELHDQAVAYLDELMQPILNRYESWLAERNGAGER